MNKKVLLLACICVLSSVSAVKAASMPNPDRCRDIFSRPTVAVNDKAFAPQVDVYSPKVDSLAGLFDTLEQRGPRELPPAMASWEPPKKGPDGPRWLLINACYPTKDGGLSIRPISTVAKSFKPTFDLDGPFAPDRRPSERRPVIWIDRLV